MNLAHVVAAMEFVDVAMAEPSEDEVVPSADEVVADLNQLTEMPGAGRTTAERTAEG